MPNPPKSYGMRQSLTELTLGRRCLLFYLFNQVTVAVSKGLSREDNTVMYFDVRF